MSAHAEVEAALRPWFAARLEADEVVISDLKRHAEGFSWQTYTMSVSYNAGGVPRVQGFAVRREPDDGLLAPYDINGQFLLHQAVIDNSRVPMPGLHWLETDPSVLGMPFYVMERMEGLVPVQWRGDDPEVFPNEEARRRLGHEYVDVLALIHEVDVDRAGFAFLGDERDPVKCTLAEIDFWERFYDESYLLEVPLIRYLVGWLRANVATSEKVGLVHGDYRIGNFMIGADRRINAVFDWELAHIGDVAFDVAWSGMPLFRGRSQLMSHLLPRKEFLDRYEEQTGLRITEEVFRFWTLFGHLRASAPHLRAVNAFEQGRTSDLRLAAMGHQNTYILKQLVDQLGWRGS